MSRYPNRIPDRPTRQIQENKPKEFRVSDLFKDYGDKNSKQRANTTTCEDYIRNLSVKNRNYTPSHYRNTTNTFSTIVKNEELKEIRLIKGYNIVDFPIAANNRVEFFYAPDGKKVDYKEITKVEEIQASECREVPTFQLKNIGFTDFYQLYMYDYELRREVELCIMATR